MRTLAVFLAEASVAASWKDIVALAINPVCVFFTAVVGCVTTCYVARQEMMRRLRLKKFEAIESAIKQLSCKSHIYLNYITLLQGELVRENIQLIADSFDALTLRLKETETRDSEAMSITLYISEELPKNDLQHTIKARDELIGALARASASFSDAELDDIKQKMASAVSAFQGERDYLESLIEKLRQELKRSGLATELFNVDRHSL